jgi:hypothetical protein
MNGINERALRERETCEASTGHGRYEIYQRLLYAQSSFK